MSFKRLPPSSLGPSLLVSLVFVLGESGGLLAETRAAEKPESSRTLLESLQQAGRQKHERASLRDLQAARGLVGASDLEDVDTDKRTALHWCVLSAQSAVSPKLKDAYCRLVEQLVNADSDVNAQDVYGNTPLDYQHSPVTQEIEQTLVEQGAQHGYSHSAQARILRLLDEVRLSVGANDLRRLSTLLQDDLPANSVLSVRLLTRVSSHDCRSGDHVEAVITAPVVVGGRTIVPSGARVEGTVLSARRAATRSQQARLQIEFCNLVHASGARTPIAAVLAEIDNAREQLNDGLIIGIPFPQTFSGRLSWGLRIVGVADPLLAHALEALSLGWQKELHREIILEPGFDMSVKILAPEKLKELPDGAPAVGSVPSDLADLIKRFQVRTTTANHVPSDLVNVLLVGERSQLIRAFESAGWTEAQKLGVKSGLKTFASLAEQKGYSEAPVSLLLLEGKKPDLVYQKQTNTFAKRHHIRIWKPSQLYQSRELWLGAATHDIGISVQRGGTHWVHRIDPEVDREQTKVKDDLLFTECVEWFALLDRPEVPRRTMNATGDEIRTEGRLLVLNLAPSQQNTGTH